MQYYGYLIIYSERESWCALMGRTRTWSPVRAALALGLQFVLQNSEVLLDMPAILRYLLVSVQLFPVLAVLDD